MLHNNKAIRQALSDIIIYDALIPMRMVSELRAIVCKLDEKMRDGEPTVHSVNSEVKNILAIQVSGICEITLEQSSEFKEARLTVDYKDIAISSVASGVSMMKIDAALTSAVAENK